VGSSAYLSILLIGAVIVLVDGQLILRGAPGYLAEVYRSPKEARQVSGMVAVLFHLVMLGVVALVTSMWIAPDADIRSVLARVGIILLLTAIGHGITMAVLSRLRQQQLDTQIMESQVADRGRMHDAADGIHRSSSAPASSPPGHGLAGESSSGKPVV
jgi:protein-S-isoprenylcysteine O-methyltransferase Ste14